MEFTSRLRKYIADTVRRWRAAPLTDLESLKIFVSERAALLAQRASREFCRNSLGHYGQAAFGDDAFQAALQVCRWESFVTVLADMLLVVEGELRKADTVDDPSLNAGLVRVYAEILAQYPAPESRPDGWGADIAAFEARLLAAIAKPPRPVQKIAIRSSKRMFETLPVKSGVHDADYQAVAGAVKFGMLSFLQDLRPMLRGAETRAALGE
jgi:hypothetical protein